MKLKTLFIGIILCGISLAGYAQSDLFERFSEEKHISMVTITKSLFQMMPDMDTNTSGIDIKPLISKLDQMEVYASEEKNTVQMMRETVKKHIKSNKSYEVMMMIKDEGSNIDFYIEKESNDIIKSFLMVADEEDEYSIIRLLGKFTLEDLQKLAGDFEN
jgi:hypothetical protein